jgi:signal transduction histidine kinase
MDEGRPDDVDAADWRSRILIVDDYPPNLTALAALLDSIGREVVTAGSGEEALGALSTGDFAVVVLDVKMPGMSGLEVARRVRSCNRNATVPIIFLTACDSDTAETLDGYAAGAVDYVRKPFEPEILRSKIAIFVELHERRELGRREAQLRAELEVERAAAARESREKDEFLSVLSHELRTPLTSILLWSDMLLHRALPPDAVARGHQIIDRCARAEAHMVENVLEMSRMATGTFAVDPHPFDLLEAVAAVIEEVRNVHESGPIALTADQPAGLMVFADRQRVVQLLFNLLDNAVKFTAGPGGGRVSVGVTQDDASVLMRIVDTGPGFSPDVRKQLFRPFRPGDSSRTRPHTGLGLGLVVANAIAIAHGGTLVVGNDDGRRQGAVVTATLPRVTKSDVQRLD